MVRCPAYLSMSGETARSESSWTTDTLRQHFLDVDRIREEHRREIAALYDRIYDERDRRYAESDRRYAETNLEQEKALKIEKQASRDALELDRTIRDYKDRSMNELREQINSERLLYATKDDVKSVVKELEATLNPVVAYVAAQQGRSGGLTAGWGYLLATIGALGTLLAIGITLLTLVRR